MWLPAGIDKELVRKAVRAGKHRTQAEAVRVAMLSYIECRLPDGVMLESQLIAMGATSVKAAEMVKLLRGRLRALPPLKKGD